MISLFWFVLALVFSCLEIEAEGKYGWAEKMPTWYRTTGFLARLYGFAMGGKPLTGYHSFMFFLPILVFHAPFFSGLEWTVGRELGTWAMYFAWCPLWDYLWFVLNPAYTAKGFKKTAVWWHAKSPWILGLFPLDYLMGWVVSIGFAYGMQLAGVEGAVATHFKMLGAFLALTFASIALSPFYHQWYKAMRERDDREKAAIFHAE